MALFKEGWMGLEWLCLKWKLGVEFSIALLTGREEGLYSLEQCIAPSCLSPFKYLYFFFLRHSPDRLLLGGVQGCSWDWTPPQVQTTSTQEEYIDYIKWYQVVTSLPVDLVFSDSLQSVHWTTYSNVFINRNHMWATLILVSLRYSSFGQKLSDNQISLMPKQSDGQL